ncbi:DUF4505 domain-containing protein [Leptospira semungkisensis]|uniref:DUF4505 domain-containing protein n=1 Tax=Leptospira semungkisensis TaxID=2484985 RepID=A0A4V3JAP4_9LEPT|nr:DUF4505 family protein [Leptospira semungkisensis]TGJ99288.1 DUF4505 domain-containing protein [Leptospira semungkisensis]
MRKYFYQIDSHGKVFHENSELIDPSFLDFFLTRLRKNRTGEHSEYPYVSPCGQELNFVSTSHYPIVFHSLKNEKLYYGGKGGIDFHPENLRLDPQDILIYPFSEDIWGRIATEIILDQNTDWEETEKGWKLLWKGKEFFIQRKDPSLSEL